jgi:FkbM family methyltransferase
MKLNNNQFYVYGAGTFGPTLVSYLVAQGKTPICVLDIMPRKAQLSGVQVLRPSEAKIDFSLPVVVSVIGYDKDIRALGFQQLMTVFEVFETFPQALYNFTLSGMNWMSAPKELQVVDTQINKLCNLLADDNSKDTLAKLVSFRKNPSKNTYPWPQGHEEYFPEDIPKLYQYDELKILDCGAFDGDTISAFYKRFKSKVSSYYAIEANARNLNRLKARLLNENIENDNWLSLHHLAVGDRIGEIEIADEGSASSISCVKSVEHTRTENVKLVTIDSLLGDKAINVLKMDIEGAEEWAIDGARSTIATHKPTLVLSIYHRPQDLWSLAFLVDSLTPNTYNYYIRHEGHWGFETVLYAIPKFL